MIRNVDYLKNRFLPGETPTSADFSDLIDSAYSDAAIALSSALAQPGLIKVSPGYRFKSIGGSVSKDILETFTTASVVSLFNVHDLNVYASADFYVKGTAGVSAEGTLNTGIKIMLDGSATPGWVQAFNKITTNKQGVIVDTSLDCTPYGISYFTSIEDGMEYFTVLHPDMASARSIVVHVSCMSPKNIVTPCVRFISSTAETINTDYSSSIISNNSSVLSYFQGPDLLIRGTGGAGTYDTTSYELTMYPMPHTKGALLQYMLFDTSASAFNTGFGTMTVNADSTIKGFRIKTLENLEFRGMGAIRIAVI